MMTTCPKWDKPILLHEPRSVRLVSPSYKKVAKVKLCLNGLIEMPITVRPDQTVESVLAYKREKEFDFDTFPVINAEGKLVGILTSSDFEFCRDRSAFVSEVMTPLKKLITVNKRTKIELAYRIMLEQKKKLLPLVNCRGEIAGMYVWKDVQRVVEGNSPYFNVDLKGQLRVAAAIGVGEQELERAELLVRKHVDALVISTAHGGSKSVIETVRAVKDAFPGVDVVAGNVSNAKLALRLAEAGADGIKVGQGCGSICTTRIVTGVGTPQVTAIYESKQAVKRFGATIMADGGIRYSGHIAIAIAAGADSTMLGRLLAGTKETPGKNFPWNNTRYKAYRGMGSLSALQESLAARMRYQQEATGKALITEGVEGIVPYAGEVGELLDQYLGSLRNSMGYVGAQTIAELQRKAAFDRITQYGAQEAHPHDVTIVKEPPNYRLPARTFDENS